MIDSEILREKQRVQELLSKESASVQDYVLRSRLAAEQAAELYGLQLRYAELPNKGLQPTARRARPARPALASG